MICSVICFLCIGFMACQTSSGHTSHIDDATKYLSQFGFLRQHDPRLGSILHKDTFTKAIREFQNFANLEVTGELNNETIRIMKIPICGVEDKRNPRPVEHSRFRRYILAGPKWDKLNLTYRVSKYPSRFGKSETDKGIRMALDEYSKISPLSFTKTYGKADIDIRFESLVHATPDGNNCTFNSYTYAHASYPGNNAYVHFNDESFTSWRITSDGTGVDLVSLAMHEFGHSLGLDHSDVQGAIMQGGKILHDDDIAGIQELYGKREIGPEDEANKNLCKDGKFDAIFTSSLGSTYILKGYSYWRLGVGGLNSGYPKPISEKWIGLPSNIDAAFSDSNGRTYFFKGSKYWRYNGETLDEGYPHEIGEDFEGISKNIDAALWVHDLKQAFLFKSTKYWVYESKVGDKLSANSSYPKLISNFNGIPSYLDDVLQVKSKVYFFKNAKYYEISDYALKLQNSSSTPIAKDLRKSLLRCS